jgi:cell division protein FtsI/penicillin-binding protein 2
MLGIFLFGLIIGYRLFTKSVIDHSRYTALAKNQYYIEKVNPSSRGTIYAHDQTANDGVVPLAVNLEKYSISLVPSNIKDKNEVAKKLAPLVGLEANAIFDLINNNKKYLPPVKKGLDKETTDKIAALNLIGVYIAPEDYRYYPENNLASHLLGFVNAEDKGNYGVEGYYDDQLKGRGGTIEGEKDTLGRMFSITKEDDVMNGTDLVLTLDRNVQYIAETKLKQAIDAYQADDGSITIVEPQTGKILAMAGYPDFDPNKYNEVPSDKADLFLNPVISKIYEPGSIFKPIVMSMAVNEGKVEPDTEGVFSNYTVVNGYEIHTAQDKAFGKETMTQVLENSDNVAMVWVSDQLGNDTMSKYIDTFGFGHKYGIDLTGETTGYVPPVKSWKDINRATISFGQGISVTPLQILMGVSAIANNGVLMKPYVVDKMIRPEKGEVVTEPTEIGRVITEDTAKKVNGMMIAVVQLGHGKKAAVPGYLVAGKTGTAQIPKPGSEGGGYYDDKHIGSFAGFFPADNPRFAMLVRLTNPKNTEWAESSAAPTFGEVAKWLLDYYQIPPNQ